MRRPNYLGLVTLTSFGWDDKPRSSVGTHSEHQAPTIKILQSLCVSHKIVETYRNQHAPKFSKGKMEWCANGSTDQSHLRMWHLLRTGQNIGQAPWAFDRMDMCAIKVFNQINQSINQSILVGLTAACSRMHTGYVSVIFVDTDVISVVSRGFWVCLNAAWWLHCWSVNQSLRNTTVFHL
jgi:hypothetical protein